jgi:hypothetical protein
MKLSIILFALGLYLPTHVIAHVSDPSRHDIYDLATREVVRRGETWSRHAAGSSPLQNPRDGTWRIFVGKLDTAHTSFDSDVPAFFRGTARELRFSKEGKVISYTKLPRWLGLRWSNG